MYIIEVIPISRGVGTNTLSYFTKSEILLGAIIYVPLRNKIVHGIVISVKKAEEIKGDIKNANFALKKIDRIKSKKFFDEDFIEMVKEVAEYYATSTGAILNILVPKYILDNINKLENKFNKKKSEGEIEKNNIIRERYVVQGDFEERYGTWKSLIRQEFAKKKSILFILPTIEDVEHTFELLEKGIEEYIFVLHGSYTPKKIVEVWNKIINEEHSVVIVTTGGFLSLQRLDIETIVVELENSKSYKIPRRPFLDIRNICEIYANKKNIKIFFADILLRIETLWRESNGELIEYSPFKFRSLSTAQDSLIDMKKYKNINKGFKILSEEVEELILKNRDNSEQMIILATRRGIAGTTVCGDCQNIVLCNKCSSPIVLHKTKTGDIEKSFFMCHRCGDRRSAEEYCKTCGSWKLGVVGIGIDLVVEKIKDKFPDITIFKIDSDDIKDRKNARSVVDKFKAKPGSILIGTEMMLQYLHGKIENSVIISLDSLFALPDFRIQEKILYILIRIRSLTTKHFLVQTRKNDEEVFDYGLKGNMNNFYKNVIEERRKFNYPPFTNLIKITLEGGKNKIVGEMEEVQKLLDPYEVEVFPAFTNTIRGNYVLHGLIRLPANKWPNKDLNEKLKSLSLSVIVKVDPETLL